MDPDSHTARGTFWQPMVKQQVMRSRRVLWLMKTRFP